MTSIFRIGIDFGGCKIEGAAIDRRSMVSLRCRSSTPAEEYSASFSPACLR